MDISYGILKWKNTEMNCIVAGFLGGFLSGFFKPTFHPCNDLIGIRRLKQRLWLTIHNGQKGWYFFYTTIRRSIFILIQITVIPCNMRRQSQQRLFINSFTWTTPCRTKFNHYNWSRRLKKCFKLFVVVEGDHLLRHSSY